MKVQVILEAHTKEKKNTEKMSLICVRFMPYTLHTTLTHTLTHAINDDISGQQTTQPSKRKSDAWSLICLIK